MNQDKMPPPVPPNVYKMVRSDGQDLAGMVQSYSLPESDAKSGGQDFTVQVTWNCIIFYLYITNSQRHARSTTKIDVSTATSNNILRNNPQ